jgi:hypothetical protein
VKASRCGANNSLDSVLFLALIPVLSLYTVCALPNRRYFDQSDLQSNRALCNADWCRFLAPFPMKPEQGSAKCQCWNMRMRGGLFVAATPDSFIEAVEDESDHYHGKA